MVPVHFEVMNSTLRRVIKRLHFPVEVMLVCVRWYAAYPLSLRNTEEMMAERSLLGGQHRCGPQPGAEGGVGGAEPAVEHDHRQRHAADPES